MRRTFADTPECALYCYAYPQGALKGSLTELNDDEEDPIGYFVSYVDAAHARFDVYGRQVFLVDED